ncbi:MAG TPA: DUF4136 domain-containing protein [Vicinamibacterales bacterium]
MKKLMLPLLCLALAAGLEAAKLKVQAEPDPAFDFATVRTWAWDADAGDVMMARTPHDDPAALKAFIDPRIRQYVEAEMTKKGKTLATSGTPDVQLHYYVLVTVQSNGQYMGQFLPSVPYWGLPPFDAGTSALEVVSKGSLVLDALLPGAKDKRLVVWRGIAQSTVEDVDKVQTREDRLKKAAVELIKRFPLKKKNK